MAPLLADVLSGCPGGNRFDAVLPVPLHRSRLAKRGFKQAELMVRGVARRINAPVLDKLKVVCRTKDQGELSAGAPGERRECLRVAGTPRRQDLLVDDVLTTGATLSECVGVLRKAGGWPARSTP